MSNKDAREKLLRLQVAYLEHLEKVKPLLIRSIRLISEGSLIGVDVDGLKRVSHKLAGSAESYGFKDIGIAAKTLELALDDGELLSNPFKTLTHIASVVEQITNATISSVPEERPILSETENPSTKTDDRRLILIADDDPMISNLLKGLFGTDVDVQIVQNGRDVEREIDAQKPDLVLLDDDMPGMRGIQIIENMHKSGNLKTTPVIMLTANDAPQNVMRAMSYGAVDYYTKPFEPMELVNKVRSLLNRMRHSVLIIDDDQTIHNLLGARFEMSGLRVISASEGREALFLMDRDTPDLIVLDRMMPGMEGGAVLHQIRKNPAHADIPVIMLTARSAKGDAHEWMRRGATDFVLKPFDPNELVLRAMRILSLDEAA